MVRGGRILIEAKKAEGKNIEHHEGAKRGSIKDEDVTDNEREQTDESSQTEKSDAENLQPQQDKLTPLSKPIGADLSSGGVINAGSRLSVNVQDIASKTGYRDWETDRKSVV